jgi:hypothetical protein
MEISTFRVSFVCMVEASTPRLSAYNVEAYFVP